MTHGDGIETRRRIGIVGSGTMGSGIAEVAGRAGFEVVVRARSQRTADACLERVERSLMRQVERGRLSLEHGEQAQARLHGVTDLDALAPCPLVIESIVEDLGVKSDVLRTLDEVCDESAVLATNTSTLPVVDLAVASGRPDRVCGLHFFNPAPAMALVEVVPALTTSEATVAEAWRFAEACGKTPVRVRDRAGFVVNALLFPYLNGAVRMLESGMAGRDDIDAAMRGGCGFPMGPFQILDLVGLDTSLAVLETLYAERRDACAVPAPLLRQMVVAGHLGRKCGRGFYEYAGGTSC